MGALRALLARISVSLLSQESPRFPIGWQFWGDPVWVGTRAPAIFQRGQQASPRIPGASGWEGSSKNLRPPGKLFFPDWLTLTCDPSSQLRAVLAQPSPGLRRARRLGPNCSNCGSSFQKGRREASRAPDPALASVGAHQWLSRDLQVIEGQKSKGLRKRMERCKIRVVGGWGGGREGSGGGRELGRPIGSFAPHQLILGQEGTNLPTNLPNGNPSGLASPPSLRKSMNITDRDQGGDPAHGSSFGGVGVGEGDSQNILNIFLH